MKSRPHNLSIKDELEIRKLLAQGTKLLAVKTLKQLTGLGLKEAKDYVDQLSPLHDDLPTEIGNLLESIEETEQKITELIEDAFPYLSEENKLKASLDREYLKSLVKTEKSSNKFGI